MPALLKRALVRLLEALFTLWVVVTLTFFMAKAVPGGPFDREREPPPEVRAVLEARYGFDQSLRVQYIQYLGRFLQGNLGWSTKFPGWTVNELLAHKIGVSAELGLWALLVALAVGLTTGIAAAARPRAWTDHTVMTFAMVGICLPTFVLGPVLILEFGVRREWVNVYGWYSLSDRALPALVLGLYYAAYLARLTRGSLLEARDQDFVRTARAKGCGSARVLLVHALRNALGPVVAYLGPTVAGLLTGSFVVETVFNIPGVGRTFVEAALDKDYDMVLGVTVLLAALVLACNWLADVALALLNPKLRAD